MSRPEVEEWAEALAEHHLVASVGFHSGRWECSCGGWSSRYGGRREHLTHVAEALAPLIERTEQAAREEGMAAVAEPVLALADEWDEVTVADEWDAAERWAAASDVLCENVPTDAAEALAQVRAEAEMRWMKVAVMRDGEAIREAKAEALREAVEALDLSGYYDPTPTGRVSTSCHLAENAARDWLRGRAAAHEEVVA